MQVKYMQDHKEENFLGVISGVTEWGMYVEIIENKCEGMVRIRDIKGDYYNLIKTIRFNRRPNKNKIPTWRPS